MEISERAKQFGAFAAVKGFEKELRKREEIFEKRMRALHGTDTDAAGNERGR